MALEHLAEAYRTLQVRRKQPHRAACALIHQALTRVAIEQQLSVVCVQSAGGASMEEVPRALMQMAKTTAAKRTGIFRTENINRSKVFRVKP